MPLPTPPIGAGDVHVWVLDLATGRQPETIASSRAVLAAHEQDRADRFKFDVDRERFIARRAALRRVLAAYLDAPPEALVFVTEAGGKPRLDTRHAGALAFSTSASGDAACIALALGAAVGVDVERRRTIGERDALAARHFSDAEKHALLTTGGRVADDPFMQVWTRKEAFLKLHGLGLVDDLDRVDVGAPPLGIATPARYASPGQPLRRALVSSHDPPGCGCSIAVATATEPTRVQFFRSPSD